MFNSELLLIDETNKGDLSFAEAFEFQSFR
jgi:hypothetical protein